MKTAIGLFSLVVVIICACCDDRSSDDGKVVFYTDAHALLNCGPLDVVIFIDNDSIGIISEPYIFASLPECLTTTKTLMVEKKPGRYNYSAILDCGEQEELNGEFEIISNQCTNIYLKVR